MTRLAQVSPGRGGTWAGRREQAVHARGPAALPAEGEAVPRRLRPDARRVPVRRRAAQHGPRDRAEPHRRVRRPGDGQREGPRRGSPTPTSRPSWPSSTSRSTSRPGCSTGRCSSELEEAVRASLNHADDVANEEGADVVMIGILPTVRPEHLTEDTFSRQPPLRAAQRAGLRGPRRGHPPGHRRRRADLDVRRQHRARGGLHQRAAAPAGQPGDVRGALERLAGDRRRAAGAGRQLAVLLRQGALARDADRALRAGRRHPLRRAQGAGRPAAGVVRRALDHLDLRPVRGERPLLPVAAADLRRRGPAGGPGPRRRAAARRAAAAQRHDLPLEPPGLRRRPRASAPARREPLPARRADRRRRPGQRRLLLRAGQGAGRGRTGRCGRRCRSPRPRRTSTPAPSTASTPASTGRASARCRSPSWCCATCCRWRTAGSRSGASRRRTRTGCSASSSSAACAA